MKYWKQITAFTLFAFFAQGQSVTYKVIKDTPDDIANYWINFGLINLSFGLDNPGFTGAGLSLNGVVHYKNKFGGDITYRNFLYTLDKETNGSTQFEIGGFYHLASKSKTKNQKVILVKKKKDQSEVSMKIPATLKRNFGIRVGYNSMTLGLDATPDKHGVASDVSLVSKTSGFYAGIIMTSTLNLKSHTVEYGIKNTGFVRRNYLDVLFLPTNKLTTIGGSDYTGPFKVKSIGFRLGVEIMQADPKKMTKTAKYRKFEIGSRPIDGYYALYTVGFNFKRKVKSMSSFVVVREKE